MNLNYTVVNANSTSAISTPLGIFFSSVTTSAELPAGWTVTAFQAGGSSAAGIIATSTSGVIAFSNSTYATPGVNSYLAVPIFLYTLCGAGIGTSLFSITDWASNPIYPPAAFGNAGANNSLYPYISSGRVIISKGTCLLTTSGWPLRGPTSDNRGILSSFIPPSTLSTTMTIVRMLVAFPSP